MVGRDDADGPLVVRIGAETVHLPTAALATLFGAIGGAVADWCGLPLPWLLGSLVVTTAAALLGLKPFGHVLALPTAIRTAFIPVIGVSIGAAFTPELLHQIPRWWPSLIALALFVPLAHALAYQVVRRTTGADAPTAYYGTMPGGFIESMTLGEAAGADAALLGTLQFLRLIACIVLIPVGFTLATGQMVGSATGEVIGGSDHILSRQDWVVLILCGLVGGVAGRRLGIPAGIIILPILLSGAAHLLDWVEGGPPGWLIDVTQLVIGTTLGARFAGRHPSILLIGARATLISIPLMLLLAAGFAALLRGPVGERWEAIFLAFAPGGLAEMALIALSLEVSVIYVSTHHVLRIVLAVAIAKGLQKRVIRR